MGFGAHGVCISFIPDSAYKSLIASQALFQEAEGEPKAQGDQQEKVNKGRCERRLLAGCLGLHKHRRVDKLADPMGEPGDEIHGAIK